MVIHLEESACFMCSFSMCKLVSTTTGSSPIMHSKSLLLLFLLFLPIFESQYSGVVFAPDFVRVLHSTHTKEMISIRRQIYLAASKRPNQFYTHLLERDPIKCQDILLRTMENDFKCYGATNEIKPHFDVLAFMYNMAKDEQLAEASFGYGNCSMLDDKNAKVCESIKSDPNITNDMDVDFVSSRIDQCRAEYVNQTGNTGNLSKR